MVPGKLQVNDQLTTNSDLILAGQNKWIIHTPDDQRRIMYIAPFTNNGWDWGNGISIDNTGTLKVNKIKIGDWTIMQDGSLKIYRTDAGVAKGGMVIYADGGVRSLGVSPNDVIRLR